MNLMNPSVKDVALAGALALGASLLLPKVLKGKTSKKLASVLMPVGGLALLGAGAVMAEKKLLHG